MNHDSASDSKKKENKDFSTIMTEAVGKATKEQGSAESSRNEINLDGGESDTEIDSLEKRPGDEGNFVPITPQVVAPPPATSAFNQTDRDATDIVMSRIKGPGADLKSDTAISAPRTIQHSATAQQPEATTIAPEEAGRDIVLDADTKGPAKPRFQFESSPPARIPMLRDHVPPNIDDLPTADLPEKIAPALPVRDVASAVVDAGTSTEKKSTKNSLTSVAPPPTQTPSDSETGAVDASRDKRWISGPKDSIPLPEQAAQSDVERRFRSLLHSEKSLTESGFSAPPQKDGDVGSARSSTASLADAPRENSSALARQAAIQIAAAVQHRPDGVTEVALNPQELGRVQMTLRLHENSVTMVIVAERFETGEMMRRHVDQLAQEFRAMGFTSVNFEFGGQSPRQGQERAQPKEKPVVDDVMTEQVHTRRPASIPSYHHGSLDLRV